MNRKPGFPSSTCSIKLPDGAGKADDVGVAASDNNFKKRQQLITFGHDQWGFKNWSWSVTRQDLDFVDFANGKYSAGVVAFVSVKIKSLDILREDVGYATSVANQKGSAIHNARKSSITNALRETLLSFGGNIASSLMDQLELFRAENSEEIPRISDIDIDPKAAEKNTSISKNVIEDKANCPNIVSHQQNRGPRKDSGECSDSYQNKSDIRSPLRLQSRNEPGQCSVVQPKPQTVNACQLILPDNNSNPNSKFMKTGEGTIAPPQRVSRLLQLSNITPQGPNVSYLVQHVMPPLYSVQYTASHNSPPPPSYPETYFAEYPSWQVSYQNYHNPCNNFNIPSKSPQFLPNSMGDSQANYISHPVNSPWVKPDMFYDGFWTEQNVKRWMSERADSAENKTRLNPPVQNHMCHSKV